MYKRFTLDEISQINTGFFENLKHIYTSRQHTFFKGFLIETMKECERVYFFKSNKPLFRIQKHGEEGYRLVDEVEKVEILADSHDINALHNIFKNTATMKSIKEDNKTILEGLMDEFQQGQRNLINDKPFVVYDIETTFSGEGIKDQHFEMAYSISSGDDNTDVMQYKYVDRDTMKRYCDYLLGYDGWIIGYNQIGFDNPVLVHNVGYGKKELEILNKKSIDPFLFLWKTIGKRISLNNVSQSLISSGKTLTSGKEGEELLQEYKKSGDKKVLNKVKKYCKNDVHITLGVMLALMKHGKIHMEGKMHEFDLQDIINKGSATNTIQENTKKNALL